MNLHPVWEKVPVSYWKFPLEDTPGVRKKGVPAEARKVSTEREGSGHQAICAAPQYVLKGWWLWAIGKKFNNSKIPYAEHEVEEKPSKQGLRQLYHTSARSTHFSQGFINFSHVYFLGEIQKWLNFETWNLLFLNFILNGTVKPFRKVLMKLDFSSRSDLLWGVSWPCLPPTTHIPISFLWKKRNMRIKDFFFLVYSLALIHSFNNMITYTSFYKVNSPIFLLIFIVHFPHLYRVLLLIKNMLVYMNKFESHLDWICTETSLYLHVNSPLIRNNVL